VPGRNLDRLQGENHFMASAWSCGTPLAVLVHDAKIELRVDVTLFGRKAVPLRCLTMVFCGQAPRR